ncbi:hypothetical protein OOK41_09270 [Micromonospora sp. NBC_01655]|uniref:hypothetical protein n=1 Tax=Micromonospora sp. NBC_01655 TaxID=2975983 RepID=UPI0022503F93|nr:hypothetical protein [Micromonospora sp. NBC_01655]MCX4470496.1 hypothetical protein [Micromonospora sp. NBC_01655]
MHPNPIPTEQPRTIKARYLAAGMAVVVEGAGEPLTAGTVHRYADDTVLVYFDGVPTPTSYGVEEGVTVVGERTEPDATTPAEPDSVRARHGQAIAEHLEHIAALIRDAHLGELPGQVTINVSLFAHGSGTNANLATVDHLAQLTGKTPEWDESGGRYGQYKTDLAGGVAWSLTGYAFERRPVSTEEQLRAKVAELEAQIAAGGAL